MTTGGEPERSHEPGAPPGDAPETKTEQPGLLGVMFFAAAAGLVLVLGLVAAVAYFLMR